MVQQDASIRPQPKIKTKNKIHIFRATKKVYESPPLYDDFFQNKLLFYIRDGEEGHQFWTGIVDARGYGVTKYRDKTISVRRAMWRKNMRNVGVGIKNGMYGILPVGHFLQQLCDESKCVNAKHMKLISKFYNSDGCVGIAAINARKTHCTRGHELAPENTYTQNNVLGRQRRDCKECHRIRRAERTGKICKPRKKLVVEIQPLKLKPRLLRHGQQRALDFDIRYLL